MAHNIALNFEDGATRIIAARDDETVSDAAYRLGINIPLDCRDGACGTCKCRVEAGSYDGGSYIEDALSQDEAAQGFALACQMRPKSNVVVAISATSTQCRTKPQIVATRLIEARRLSETSIGFSLERPAEIAFLPGQYVNIQVPGSDAVRSYSFSSAPGAATLDFLVRDIPGGRMSTWLREVARPGDAAEFVGPLGSFYLRDVNRPVLFLSGGTGLAPFLSMLGQLSVTGSAHPVHLVHGVTHDADLVAIEALEDAATRLPFFSFTTCVASESSTHPRRGYVTDHLTPEQLNAGDIDIYLCGPPPMVDAVRAWLSGQGITPAAFHTEKFAASGPASKLAA
ncbi:MAG: NADH oxidase [Rhodospirillales bacterium 20-64-7]|nr:MAG: NADH oxidase [Rhodospirillales bacterium 20-64-7]HQT77429.1 benzoate 1,2-dioxygenase electron transfer component BenC [Rhodopila sp.]